MSAGGLVVSVMELELISGFSTSINWQRGRLEAFHAHLEWIGTAFYQAFSALFQHRHCYGRV